MIFDTLEQLFPSLEDPADQGILHHHSKIIVLPLKKKDAEKIRKIQSYGHRSVSIMRGLSLLIFFEVVIQKNIIKISDHQVGASKSCSKN